MKRKKLIDTADEAAHEMRRMILTWRDDFSAPGVAITSWLGAVAVVHVDNFAGDSPTVGDEAIVRAFREAIAHARAEALPPGGRVQ